MKIWFLLLLLTIRAAAPTLLRPAVCEGNSSRETGISCSHEGNRRSTAARGYVRVFIVFVHNGETYLCVSVRVNDMCVR